MKNIIHNEDWIEGLKKLPDESVNCCVTSPPYFGLRDYGVAGQLGLEETPEEYCRKIVEGFEQVSRVLRKDGTLWLNIGDSYAGSMNGQQKSSNGNWVNTSISPASQYSLSDYESLKKRKAKRGRKQDGVIRWGGGNVPAGHGIKPKDLFGIPWMIAFALRSAGWYLRSDIIWAKPNCMPESVTDRPTRSHEYIFLFSKSSKYYYDHDAIKEPALYDVDGSGTSARRSRVNPDDKSIPDDHKNGIRAAGFKDAARMNGKNANKERGHSKPHKGFNDHWDNMTTKEQCTGMRNKRDVWTVPPAQFPEAHFATFPEYLIVPCIKAGCPENGIILDPFMGAGTTALVARKLNRNFIGFELNPEYIKIAETRLKNELGMFI